MTLLCLFIFKEFRLQIQFEEGTIGRLLGSHGARYVLVHALTQRNTDASSKLWNTFHKREHVRSNIPLCETSCLWYNRSQHWRRSSLSSGESTTSTCSWSTSQSLFNTSIRTTVTHRNGGEMTGKCISVSSCISNYESGLDFRREHPHARDMGGHGSARRQRQSQ